MPGVAARAFQRVAGRLGFEFARSTAGPSPVQFMEERGSPPLFFEILRQLGAHPAEFNRLR
jgi:hypothetical protein